MDKKFVAAQAEKLKEEKAKILNQIKELKKGDPFADPDHANDNAAIDTDAREQIGHDTIEAEIHEMSTRVKDIDIALERIQKNRYGYCERCDKAILRKRLELIPEARYCVECESKIRK